ncbi:hypothetical protein RirG_260520 [Rhizophagus irregularis DAOM 197198w]|uniref:Uncharacterized protein n=1 Tax=Rhizophagus irregularis (strain DAOM 197198w) TaxID=1432141 RepID=A0A015JWU5_RHIIW|nr:hypothetical protein RirG_260520 [Rhizophagus irregularis DAOM 197198w]
MDHTIWFQTPNNANVGESAHANINCDGRDISLLSGIGRQWESVHIHKKNIMVQIPIEISQTCFNQFKSNKDQHLRLYLQL